MSTIKPLYGAETAITITLNSLASNSIAASSAIDNSATLFQDFRVDIDIAGTVSANAYLDVRVLPSDNGINFATFDNGVPLGIIDLSGSTPQTAAFSLCANGNMLMAPKAWKLAVKNITGAALAASGNAADYIGENLQNV